VGEGVASVFMEGGGLGWEGPLLGVCLGGHPAR